MNKLKYFLKNWFKFMLGMLIVGGLCFFISVYLTIVLVGFALLIPYCSNSEYKDKLNEDSKK